MFSLYTVLFPPSLLNSVSARVYCESQCVHGSMYASHQHIAGQHGQTGLELLELHNQQLDIYQIAKKLFQYIWLWILTIAKTGVMRHFSSLAGCLCSSDVPSISDCPTSLCLDQTSAVGYSSRGSADRDSGNKTTKYQSGSSQVSLF